MNPKEGCLHPARGLLNRPPEMQGQDPRRSDPPQGEPGRRGSDPAERSRITLRKQKPKEATRTVGRKRPDVRADSTGGPKPWSRTSAARAPDGPPFLARERTDLEGAKVSGPVRRARNDRRAGSPQRDRRGRRLPARSKASKGARASGNGKGSRRPQGRSGPDPKRGEPQGWQRGATNPRGFVRRKPSGR